MCLQKSFLGDPEMIKVQGVIGHWPGLDAFDFCLRIKPFGKFQRFEIAADPFEIDPDILSFGHREQHPAVRMREVKAQPLRTAMRRLTSST